MVMQSHYEKKLIRIIVQDLIYQIRSSLKKSHVDRNRKMQCENWIVTVMVVLQGSAIDSKLMTD